MLLLLRIVKKAFHIYHKIAFNSYLIVSRHLVRKQYLLHIKIFVHSKMISIHNSLKILIQPKKL